MGSKAIKVVLDTNVLISALLWQGNIKEILKLAKDENIIICVSQEIILELENVLAYPKLASHLALTEKTPQQIVNGLLEIMEYYNTEPFGIPVISQDPSDDKFLSCALAAGALFIVSGDNHLLRLKQFYNIPILTPNEFLKKLRQR